MPVRGIYDEVSLMVIEVSLRVISYLENELRLMADWVLWGTVLQVDAMKFGKLWRGRKRWL